MSGNLQNPMFWCFVSLVVFLAFAYWKVRKPVLAWLDSEIVKIREELERARQLRAEAEATLAEYKKKYAAAMAEAEDILRFAKEEAVQLKIQAEAELKAALTRHEQQAADRIRVAEAEALAAVRAAAVDGAMELARRTLADHPEKAGKLIDQAIAELPNLAAKKAKAA